MPPASGVLLAGVCGSRAHGTATSVSDTDVHGVWASPVRELGSLRPPSDADQTWEYRSAAFDVTMHEAAKLCRLALAQDFAALELLHLPPALVRCSTPLGHELQSLRGAFACAERLRRAYLDSFALKSVKWLSSHPDPSDERRGKMAMHTKRLLEQGYRYYSTGEFRVAADDPAGLAEFGEACQRDPGGTACARLAALVQHYADAFAASTPAIPGAPDEDAVEAWLRDVREYYGAQPERDGADQAALLAAIAGGRSRSSAAGSSESAR